MGAACSSGAGNDVKTEALDKELQISKLKDDLHFKILCLGAGESGKSTVVKQLFFIHKRKMDDEERSMFVPVLHSNVMQSIGTLIAQEYEDITYTETEIPLRDAVKQALDEDIQTIPTELATKITTLWNGPTLQAIWAKRSDFWHLEATDFYLSNVERFVESDFLPTEEDIVYARKRTTGVITTEFDYGHVHFSVVDVGGQRSERRKWMSCFDDVKAIIFVANLAGYGKVLFEDSKVNRMAESLDLFETTMANSAFATTPIFLFLNKKDLFETMINDQALNKTFPEYEGENSVHDCIEFIAKKYKERLPEEKKDSLQFFPISARFKGDVKSCFSDVRDILTKNNKKTIDDAVKKLEKLSK
jgi:GTPase SAR1 family protein